MNDTLFRVPLTQLPIFDEHYANCASCPLKTQCQHDPPRLAYSYRPEVFNGIMIVGEGPGQQEVVEGRPFVGKSGQLLRAILESIGVKIDECYLANATLAKPPPHNGSLQEDFPGAIESCLSRLEAEINAVRPRVIVPVGAAAWIAVSGYDITEQKRVHFECADCDPTTRHTGPVIVCGNTIANADGTKGEKCGHIHFLTSGKTKETVDPEEVFKVKAACEKCKKPMKSVRPKTIKCLTCGGRRMRYEPIDRFVWDYNLSQVAGAIFEPRKPGEAIQAHHLGTWLSEAGVKYVIPTLHPAFLLRGQQFAMKSVQKHFQKAARLAREDVPYDVPFTITKDPEVVREYCWRWLKEKVAPPNFTVDIETDAVSVVDGKEVHGDAREIIEVKHVKCIGIGSRAVGHALVVDTREVNPQDPDDPLLSVLYEFLTDDRIPKTYHNGACYDIPVLDLTLGIPWDQQVNSYADDTLHAHADLYPDSPHKLETVTFEFTYARAWKPPKERKGEIIHGNFEELAAYNARDVLNTDESRVGMGVDRGQAVKGGRMWRADLQDIYEQDSKIRKIALSMTMRGLPINEEVFAEVGDKARAKAESTLAQAREILATTRFEKPEEFKPSKDLIRALFDTSGFGLPVLNRTKKADKPSTEKTDLVNLMTSVRDNEAQAFIRTVLAYKADQYVVTNYVESLRLWADGRIHGIWKPWGTRTGRFSSNNPNCFDGETEVLTPDGWVRFDEYTSQKVAQWSEDGTITMVQPDAFIRNAFSGSLVHVKNIHIDLRMTPDHRCLLKHRKTGKLRVFAADEYPEDWQQINAGVGTFGELSLSPPQIAMICATQADGHYTAGKQIEFRFSKARKLHRLLWAVRELGFVHRVRTGLPDRKTYVVLTDHTQVAWIKSWLTNKHFDSRMLQLNKQTRGLFCEEVFLWDGCATRMSHYASNQKVNADIVQAALSLHGIRARQRVYKGKRNPSYQVDVTHQDYSLTTNISKRTSKHSGFVYCVSVPSSYILVRRNGCVMVTGNCQNWPKWLRIVVATKPGRKIVGADYDQLELRAMALLSGDAELTRRCMTADGDRKLEPDHDPHSYVASLAFMAQYTGLHLKDPKHIKDDKVTEKCKCETCKRKALRDIIKRVIYGLGYGAGDATVLEAIYDGGYNGPPITLNMIAHVRATVFKAFQDIEPYRQRSVREAMKSGELRSPIYGRRRIFPLNEIPITEIYNYGIQSFGADLMNERIIILEARLADVDPTAFIIAQVHDAIYIECNEDRAEAVAALMQEVMTTSRRIEGGPLMDFTASAAIANNWKDAA
jgi:uracil-DNA glycosylase family 4